MKLSKQITLKYERGEGRKRTMKNILEYLEKTAEKYSDRIAADDGTKAFTWKELLEKSKRIGSALCRQTEPGKPIVFFMEKSTETLAAMFGAVYAGCFYVMIDPTQPPERIRGFLQILEAELIVTEKAHETILKQAGFEKTICVLQDLLQVEIQVEKLDEIRKSSKDTDLLYGIFTSGSTGKPKSIVVNHRAVMDFITHFTETFSFNCEDRIGNQAPFDFDVSVKDIYTSIFTGASLILIPKKMFSTPPVLLDYLCEKRVTVLIWAVSALTLISSLKGLNYRVPDQVKKIMFSGEVMPVKQLKLWQKALPETEFVNLYGPTEITCNCTYYRVKRIFEENEKLPLGIPFDGRNVFLQDEQGRNIHDAGVIGEICVSGESLADGYYHNLEETEKKFVFPDRTNRNSRYYRTGDLGYYDENGAIFFAGRKDFQIKHMGHRIELEEIEQALNQIDGIEKSCCMMDRKKNQLTAFYFGEIPAENIRKQLRSKIPVYMIPHKMIKMQHIPLTKNGKMDRDYFRRKLEVGA